MTLTSQIRDRIVALVPNVEGRCFPDVLPLMAELPAVVYQRVSSVPYNTIEQGPPTLAATRVQFSCWADTSARAGQLAEALYGALGGWRDQSLPVRIDGALVVEDAEDRDADSMLYRRRVDVTFMHAVDSEGS